MPRSRRYSPGDSLPGTLRRSGREAQEAFTRAYNDAVRACGEGDEGQVHQRRRLGRMRQRRQQARIAALAAAAEGQACELVLAIH